MRQLRTGRGYTIPSRGKYTSTIPVDIISEKRKAKPHLLFLTPLHFFELQWRLTVTDVKSVINIFVYLQLVLPAQGKLVSQQVTQLLRNLVQSEVSIHASCSNLYSLKDRFERQGGKTCNIATFDKFCAMPACCKTSCTLFWPVLPQLNTYQWQPR